MLFWNGKQMISKPDVVQVLPQEQKTTPIVPVITPTMVAGAIEDLAPRQQSWSPYASVEGE